MSILARMRDAKKSEMSQFATIQQALDYEFKDVSLLVRALTRRSALNEGHSLARFGDFQRLEFIGDKVLNLVISDVLFEIHPDWKEGELTSEASKFVNNKGPLAEIATRLGLDKGLIMGTGEKNLNLAGNTKVLSDAFESVIGAIWVDSKQNYPLIKKFIVKQFPELGLLDLDQEELLESPDAKY